MPVPEQVDVLVVGGGLAGLAAARHLSAGGREAHVVEAADAVGGRVRTDVVDGFRCDRGFQVLSTGYPELARLVDLDELDLRPFRRGVLLHLAGRTHRIVDPRREPAAVLAFLRAPLGTAAEKAALAGWASYAGFAPAGRLRAGPDRTARAALLGRGLGRTVDTVVAPFLAGVLLERDLATSARFVDLLMRTFVRGDSTVPAMGMQALPAQIADDLPRGRVHLRTLVRGVRIVGDGADGTAPVRVHLDSGQEVRAGAAVVATDMDTAVRLLPEGAVSPRPWKGVTTLWHAAPEPPTDEALLLVDADGGLVASSAVLTNAAPSYSPDGRALVATSVVHGPGVPAGSELVRAVTARLATLWATNTERWELVTAHHVAHALPEFRPPAPLRRPVSVPSARGRLVVCGDHRDTASIQGALVSGRRAAAALLR